MAPHRTTRPRRPGSSLPQPRKHYILERTSDYATQQQAVDVVSTLTLLSNEQKHVMDYFLSTAQASHKFAFFRVSEVVRITDPQFIYYASARGTKGTFCQVSASTVSRAKQAWPHGRLCYDDTVRHWAAAYNVVINSTDIDVVFTAATPHAVLLASGEWTRYAHAIADSTGKRMRGWELAAPLLPPGERRLARAAVALNLAVETGPDTWDSMADVMRHLLRYLPAGHDLLAQETESWIQHLDNMKSMAIRQTVDAFQKHIKIDHLIECVMLAGTLRSALDTKYAIRKCLKVMVKDVGQLNHLLGILDGAHYVPSASTLRKHRLTVHLGFCRFLSVFVSRLLEVGGVRWGSMDLSPQAGVNWLLQCSYDCLVTDLEECYDLSSLLGVGGAQVADDANVLKDLRGIHTQKKTQILAASLRDEGGMGVVFHLVIDLLNDLSIYLFICLLIYLFIIY